MNSRRTLSKVSLTVAIATLLAMGAIWEVRRVRAVAAPDPERGLFGMVEPLKSNHTVGSIALKWAGASLPGLSISLWTIPAGLPMAEITYSG